MDISVINVILPQHSEPSGKIVNAQKLNEANMDVCVLNPKITNENIPTFSNTLGS